MKTKIVNYGTEYEVLVIHTSKYMIMVKEPEINEAFVLINHGLQVLPQINDVGRIVFEKDSNKGHWQYYPNKE